MSTTTFTNGVSLSDADWFNDVDAVVYEWLGDGTTEPASRAAARDNFFTGGSTGSSAPVINATQTWNSAGTTFTGLKLNITDTNSAAASLLADLQVGGTSKGKLDKSGNLTITGALVVAGAISGATTIAGSGALTMDGNLTGKGGSIYIANTVGHMHCKSDVSVSTTPVEINSGGPGVAFYMFKEQGTGAGALFFFSQGLGSTSVATINSGSWTFVLSSTPAAGQIGIYVDGGTGKLMAVTGAGTATVYAIGWSR